MTRHVLRALLAAPLLASPAWSGDVAIILNPVNPKADVSLADLSKIFKLEQQHWGTGQRIELALQETGSAKETVILKRVYGMSPGELRKHWLGKVFRGEIVAPPRSFASDASVKRYVGETPNAISFIDSALVDGSVKPLKIDGKLPGESGYALSRGPD